MPGNMGYNYPFMQEHFYPIQRQAPQGYISPMEMTFKEALEHAMRVTGRAKSLRDLAVKAGVSYDILKNISQNKSERPNAEAAAKIADFFGASLKDFYAGRVSASSGEDTASIAADTEQLTGLLRLLEKKHRDQVQEFAKSLLVIQEAAERTK